MSQASLNVASRRLFLRNGGAAALSSAAVVLHGTHQGEFLGIPATGKKVRFYTVDAMQVGDGKITEHWGVATLLDLT